MIRDHQDIMRLKRAFTFGLLFLFLFQIPYSASLKDASITYVNDENIHHSDSFFIRNEGQLDDIIDFYSLNDAFNILFLKDRIIINQVLEMNNDIVGSNIEIFFRNSSCKKITGNLQLNHSTVFLMGNEKIHTESFKEIIMENVWDYIDLIFYYNHESFLFKFQLYPGSDSEDIKLQVSDNSNTVIDDGKIQISNELNDISITPPLTYYKQSKQMIISSFTEMNENEISMDLGNYDKGREIIIDPVINSTFLGGKSFDSNRKIIYEENRLYVIGNTSSLNFPTTPGVYQISKKNYSDIFISVFDNNLSRLVSSTYIGGNGSEYVDDIVIVDDNITVFGWTNSKDFPVTLNAYQRMKKESSDCFLTTLDVDCTEIKYSTFIGGNDMDRSVSMAYHNNHYYISGNTESWDFPTTENSFNITYINNSFDYEMMFISSFSLEYELDNSTFLGGYRHDKLSDISIIDGNLFFIGYSNSDDFPISGINYSNSRAGSYDIVFGSMNLNLDELRFSSFMGGTGSDYSRKIFVDDNKLVFTGSTYSSNYPTTSNAMDSSYNGNGDSFITIIGLDDTSRLLYSSYLGGGNYDTGYDIIDTEDYYIIAGKTGSSDFPLDGFILDESHNGNDDGYVIIQDKNNYSIYYSSFIGGSFDDEIISLSLSGSNVICSGNTYSNNFPIYSGLYSSYSGFNDVFILILNLSTPPGKPSIVDYHSGNQFINFSWVPNPYDGGAEILHYDIYRSENNISWSLITQTNRLFYNDTNITNGIEYFFKMKSKNIAGESYFSNVISSIPKTVPQPPIFREITQKDLMINISWDYPISNGGAEITQFILYRGIEIHQITFFREIPEHSFYFIDNSIELGIDYYYQISSINEIGESERSPFRQFRITDLPEPPTTVSMESGDNFINISWNEPSNNGGLSVLGYRIYRGEEKGNEVLLSTTENLFFNDTQVLNGNEYFYEISSVNSKGESIEKMATNGIPSRIPDAPIDLTIEFDQSSTSICLSWMEPFDGGEGIDEYLIFKKVGGDTWKFINAIGNSLNNYIDFDISLGITYSYRILARNDNGNSVASEEKSIKIILPPDTVQITIIRSGPSFIALTWTLPQSNGGDSQFKYHLFRGIGTDICEEYQVLDGKIQFYNDTDLHAGNEYYYYIIVVNEIYQSSESNMINELVLDAPDPVSKYQMSSGNGWIQISWSLPENLGGSDNIIVRILRNASSDWSIIDSNVENGFFNDTYVINGIEYSYLIQIENEIGLSNSEMISAIPVGPPMSIRNLSVVLEDRKVKITWDSPISNGGSVIIEYKIYRSDDGKKFELIKRIRDMEYFYYDMIPEDGNYFYKIEAINEIGISESGPVFIVVEGEDGNGDNHILKYIVLIAIILITLAISLLVIYIRLRRTTSNPQTEEMETQGISQNRDQIMPENEL